MHLPSNVPEHNLVNSLCFLKISQMCIDHLNHPKHLAHDSRVNLIVLMKQECRIIPLSRQVEERIIRRRFVIL